MTMSKRRPSATRASAQARTLVQRGEVELDQFEAAAAFAASRTASVAALCLVEVAGGADDMRAVRREDARGLDAEPGRDARHEDALAAVRDPRLRALRPSSILHQRSWS
jgi:hypothetical protein